MLSASAAAAVFFASFLVSCASFSFLVAAFFFYRDDNILIPFLELGHFNVVFLGFFLVFSIHSRLARCVSSPGIYFLLRHVDQDSGHYTSVVTSQVKLVVGLSVLHIPQVSSLGQNVVDLFFPPFRRTKEVCSAAFF